MGDNVKLTPLHIAAHEGHTAVLERLVGYGADLNAEVEDGNTALHLIIALKKMRPLSQDTPHLLKVRPVIEYMTLCVSVGIRLIVLPLCRRVLVVNVLFLF